MLNHGKYSDLTPEQYEYLGRAFIEWSNVEFLLGVLLSRLLFVPEFLGRTYSDEMSAARLEAAIKNALDIHKNRYEEKVISSEMNDKIVKILNEASKCRVMRNKFAHYLWMRDSDSKIFGAKMSGKIPGRKKDNEAVSITLKELKGNYSAAYSLVEEIKSIIFELPKIDEKRNITNSCSGPA